MITTWFSGMRPLSFFLYKLDFFYLKSRATHRCILLLIRKPTNKKVKLLEGWPVSSVLWQTICSRCIEANSIIHSAQSLLSLICANTWICFLKFRWFVTSCSVFMFMFSGEHCKTIQSLIVDHRVFNQRPLFIFLPFYLR